MDLNSIFDNAIDFDPNSDLIETTAPLPPTPGLCLLADTNDQPILLLYGANIRQIVRRRLTPTPQDQQSKRTDLRPVTAKIRFRQCGSAFESQMYYFLAVQHIYPDRIDEFFPRLDPWLLHLNPNATYPCFTVTHKYQPRTGRCWGPFAARKSAAACCEILEICFDLCRHPEHLGRPEQIQRCSYAQINKCAVLCNPNTPPDLYRNTINQAVHFMDQPAELNIELLQNQMDDLAKNLRFEDAQRIKEKLRHAKILTSKPFRWIGPLDTFCILSFQTGLPVSCPEKKRKTRTLAPFILQPDRIIPLDLVPADQIDQHLPDILTRLELTLQNAQPNENIIPGQWLGWITRFLYGNQSEKGLYLRADRLPDADQIVKMIQEYFASKAKNNSKSIKENSQ